MIPNGPRRISLATAPPPAAPAPPPAYMQPMRPTRPAGVAILAIITIIIGILTFFGGLALIGIGTVGAIFNVQLPAAFAIGIGVLATLLGLVAIAAGIGLWRLRTWAWWLTIIIGVVSIISSGVQIALGGFAWVGLVLWLIIVVYLIAVRKHFVARPMSM